MSTGVQNVCVSLNGGLAISLASESGFVCNVVQRIPWEAASIGLERPSHEKADPGFPRSAAIGSESA
jgi:hypothetical protein